MKHVLRISRFFIISTLIYRILAVPLIYAEPAEPVCEPADEDIDKLFRVVAGNTADIMTLKQDVQALKTRSVSRPEQRIPNDFGKPYTGPQNHRPYTPPPKWEPNAPKRP